MLLLAWLPSSLSPRRSFGYQARSAHAAALAPIFRDAPICLCHTPLDQGLHIEDNDLASPLPLAPYLRTLQELLLDWQAALDSPEALRAATSLSRLVLSGHRAVDLHPDGTLTVRPAKDAEPLLAALAAMPALRLVEDIQGEVRPVVHCHAIVGR